MSRARSKSISGVGDITKKGIIYLLLLAAAFFYLFPIYTAVNTSLKSNQELAYGPVNIVRNPEFANYLKAFSEIDKPIWNSFVITMVATAISSALGAWGGFGYSKLKFRGSSVLFLILVLGFYIAPQSILIPLLRFIGSIGLYNSYWGLILTHTAYGVPITTLLFRNYFESLPTEVVDSARIDGCSYIGTFFRIALPLSLPGFAVVAIFQFTNIWNEFLFGLILTRGADSQPLTVAIGNLKGTTVASWNIQMAGMLISVLPVLIVYIFFLKLIVKGLLMGSVKG
ncbi:MAG: carbohydrate ABC transporter permease [Mesotoga sp.]|jgi:glucose/mannose transport system permease protein|uniref:carbohydrate ABC transporter permease n=1 Tax=unclassified Mesotoga TaxID=1184398 RepID=UPI000EF1BFD8|nr:MULTISPECIES: carbohydrate ABC transporter permease [unclassified Mesotoga]MDI9367497.1 carbohydrate ABC transporter permease [Thermotogota bacterium]NLT46071.1 carbohydrate ABC transporter permease [Thermotogaceae bacterium]MDD2334444.1 carbohydrate ABC transporter permease [Mesotoga sp.]MDD3681507.1 carbohydrate ABC transporter permease [Mesotoga sp.]MDD4826209.1 carbohydrate ABC transporter permease [Mesotoga sp.]